MVLDLALPGPERLSGEGALMGAIPIVSSRWNGTFFGNVFEFEFVFCMHFAMCYNAMYSLSHHSTRPPPTSQNLQVHLKWIFPA